MLTTSRPRPRLALLVCVLSSSLVGLDSLMSTVALPAIARDLDAGLAVQQWVVAAFLLGLGSLLLVGGALGDAYDRWAIMGIGTAGFGIAALACALAPTAPVLIAARLVQGAAAALTVPAALSLITATFEGEERSRAIRSWTAWSGVSVVVGPLLGGVLVDAISWRATFAILVPLSAVVLVLVARGAPSPLPRGAGTAIDRVGALLGVVLVGGPVFALIQGPELGWTHPLVLGAAAAGGMSAWAFLHWERRAVNALLPLGLFRSRAFSVLSVVTFVLYGALIASGVYTVLFLSQTAGYSSTAAGLAAAVPIVVLFVLSPWLGSLSDRSSPRLFVAGGALVAGAGILLLLRVDADADFVGAVLPSVLLHGIGLTMLVAPLTAGVLGAAGDEHAGVASGFNSAVARIGSLLGVAVVGLVVSAQFSASVDRLVGDQPAVERVAQQARERPLVAAPAGDLPAAPRAELAQDLRSASLDAFRLGVVVIGGLAVLAALLAFVGMPGRCRLPAAGCPGGALAGAHRDLEPA
jgi:EmrB/QacA subfamily drug resistance transporter